MKWILFVLVSLLASEAMAQGYAIPNPVIVVRRPRGMSQQQRERHQRIKEIRRQRNEEKRALAAETKRLAAERKELKGFAKRLEEERLRLAEERTELKKREEEVEARKHLKATPWPPSDGLGSSLKKPPEPVVDPSAFMHPPKRGFSGVSGTSRGGTSRGGTSRGGIGGSSRVHVRGYYRKDGTYVRPHTRSYPRR